MKPERWQQIDRMFAGALAQPADRRGAWLEAECGDDHEMRREVDELLAAERAVERFLSVPVGDVVLGEPTEAASEAASGRQIGPYRLGRQIGQGGMSTVYLATRADGQFEREVAIKLIRRGFETARILHRFRTERQILAQLEHPSIARLYDGGTTERGHPFLVMEYIEGLPFDRFADNNRLGLRARIELFEQVLMAVHHAHRNLLVHRDLKPSNILVTREGEVKLLDFGIAKLLTDQARPKAPETRAATPEARAATLGATGVAAAREPTATETGLRPMTPGFASPEQVLGEAVTTASDVYALGVVLYRLLAGVSPYRLPEDTADALEEAIVARPVVAPSEAVAALSAEAAESVATARSTTPKRLIRRLAPDLDAIIRKALEKRPDDRYPSALALRDDLERARQHRPVAARPRTFGYVARRFLRRNAVAVTSGAVAAALIVGLSIVSFFQARIAAEERVIAETERERAESVSEFLFGVFAEADPNRTQGREVSVRDVIDRAAENLEALDEQPEQQAIYRFTVAEIYRTLGDYDRALELFRQAIADRVAIGGERQLEVAAIYDQLAVTLQQHGDMVGAEAPMRKALEIRGALLGEDSDELLPTLNNLGLLLFQRGEYEEANRLLGETARRVEAGEGRLSDASAITKSNYAMSIHEAGDYEAAEAIYRDVVAVWNELYGDEHTSLSSGLHNLAAVFHDQGRLPESEAMFRRALAMREKLLGLDHQRTVATMVALAETISAQARFDEAEAMFEKAIEIGDRALAPDHYRVASARAGLARVMLATGRPEAGESLARVALAALGRSGFDPEHYRVAYAEAVLGGCASVLGRDDEAEALLESAHARLRDSLTDREPMTIDARGLLEAHRDRVRDGAGR